MIDTAATVMPAGEMPSLSEVLISARRTRHTTRTRTAVDLGVSPDVLAAWEAGVRPRPETEAALRAWAARWSRGAPAPRLRFTACADSYERAARSDYRRRARREMLRSVEDSLATADELLGRSLQSLEAGDVASHLLGLRDARALLVRLLLAVDEMQLLGETPRLEMVESAA